MKYAVTIPLNPVPASRPRVSRWGTYYSKTYKDWRAAAMKAVPKCELPVYGPLSVTTEIVVEKPRTSKRAWPRGDNDNYEKAAWDVITALGYWADDDQIVANSTTKRFAEPGERPYTTVRILPL